MKHFIAYILYFILIFSSFNRSKKLKTKHKFRKKFSGYRFNNSKDNIYNKDQILILKNNGIVTTSKKTLHKKDSMSLDSNYTKTVLYPTETNKFPSKTQHNHIKYHKLQTTTDQAVNLDGPFGTIRSFAGQATCCNELITACCYHDTGSILHSNYHMANEFLPIDGNSVQTHSDEFHQQPAHIFQQGIEKSEGMLMLNEILHQL